jgi:hypothetical protein
MQHILRTERPRLHQLEARVEIEMIGLSDSSKRNTEEIQLFFLKQTWAPNWQTLHVSKACHDILIDAHAGLDQKDDFVSYSRSALNCNETTIFFMCGSISPDVSAALFLLKRQTG